VDTDRPASPDLGDAPLGPAPELVLTPPDAGRGSRAWLSGAIVFVLIVGVGAVAGFVNLATHHHGKASATSSHSTSSGSASSGAFAQTAGAPAPLVVLAHRGGEEKFPHETLPALVSAVQAGDAAETDVHWTSDNVAILMHEDDTVAPGKANDDTPINCSGGPYVIAKTTWKVLQTHCKTIASASKDGTQYPIATFDETMKAVAAVPGGQIFAEVKNQDQTIAQTALFMGTIEKYGMARRAVVTSFFPNALARVRAQAAADGVNVRLMLFVSPVKGKLPPVDEVAGQHLYAVAVQSPGVTAPYVAALKAKKLVVIDWTINTPKLWAAAKKAGVTAVLTDRPTAYRAWRT
jgi:glycerophosphoryl diester phosphodiesterase